MVRKKEMMEVRMKCRAWDGWYDSSQREEAPISGDILKAAGSQGGNSREITKMKRRGLKGKVIEEIFGLMNERVS